METMKNLTQSNDKEEKLFGWNEPINGVLLQTFYQLIKSELENLDRVEVIVRFHCLLELNFCSL